MGGVAPSQQKHILYQEQLLREEEREREREAKFSGQIILVRHLCLVGWNYRKEAREREREREKEREKEREPRRKEKIEGAK
jgi:hypothetical protein